MKSKNRISHRKYFALGSFLREARKNLIDKRTAKAPSVAELAKQLDLSSSFVYQVEQGFKKPRDGNMGKWASVYGVRYVDIWKPLDRIPMDLVSTLKEDAKLPPEDPFSKLTKYEKAQLLPFLEFVRWKTSRGVKVIKSRERWD